MKKIFMLLITVLAVVALTASLAMAETSEDKKKEKAGCSKSCTAPSGAKCGEKPAKATKCGDSDMGKCCVEAALDGKGCCGKSADEVKAAVSSCSNIKEAKAGMHECCAEALDAGKGCCGKDAKAVKAGFMKKLCDQKACEMAKADMDECCAKALDDGKGCCGKDAKELKADYEKNCKKAAKKLSDS